MDYKPCFPEPYNVSLDLLTVRGGYNDSGGDQGAAAEPEKASCKMKY